MSSSCAPSALARKAGQLVDGVFADEVSDSGNAWIAGKFHFDCILDLLQFDHVLSHFFSIADHRAEFPNEEGVSFKADALLSEEDGSGILEFDACCGYSENRR